jgi:hypothetical protein
VQLLLEKFVAGGALGLDLTLQVDVGAQSAVFRMLMLWLAALRTIVCCATH